MSWLLFLFAASIQWTGAPARGQALDARVASVNGPALRRTNQRAFILSRGDLLNPGDEIDTRGGGRVVIELTDGSVVVIHPNSRIAIQDYRSAASLREMFRIIIGRVRVRVAHYGGKPNPYRVNSPTASILVRGTEFGVAVEPSGDTRVEVYEGLVEVQSLKDTRRRAYLSAGRGALVRPNEDIRFFTPGVGGVGGNGAGGNGAGGNGDGGNDDVETNARANTNSNFNRYGSDDGGNGAGDNANTNLNIDANENENENTNGAANANANANTRRNNVRGRVEATQKSAARRTEDKGLQRSDTAAKTTTVGAAKITTNVRTNLVNDYERYVDSLAGLGWSLPLRRFTAFADSHFDSLDNPAYSTEIATIEGRVWLIPYFNKARGADPQSGFAGYPLPGNLMSPFDSGLLAQGDFFIPVDRARAVIGGSVAVGADQSQSLTGAPPVASMIPLFPEGGGNSRYVAISTETTSVTGSLMVARRFGDEGRTSAGAGVELISSGGGLLSHASLANSAGALTTEDLQTGSQISRRRFLLGVTREFDGGHKLGLLYRHESASADDFDRSRIINGMPLGLDSTHQDGRSSEVSFRLRGPFTHRLFYGLEGSLLWGGSDGQILRAAFADSTTRAGASSAGASFGLGFALRQMTVLSADFAFGDSRVHEKRENATRDQVEERRQGERFWSAHLGLQTDVWRRSFVSASALVIGAGNTIDLSLFPDLSGQQLTSLGLTELDGHSRRNSTTPLSDFGGGWRFTPNLVAEYIFSINTALGPARHIFMLRYIFKREKSTLPSER